MNGEPVYACAVEWPGTCPDGPFGYGEHQCITLDATHENAHVCACGASIPRAELAR